MTTAAILVAAGRGTRAGGDTPKQWQMLGTRCVAEHALRAFTSHPQIDHVIVVANPDDHAAKRLPKVQIVDGGDTRQASVMAGLSAISGQYDHVLIHDAARPLVTSETITRVIHALTDSDAAAPAIPVVDALWHGHDDSVAGVQDRTGLFRAQTPQGFNLAKLIAAQEFSPKDAADDVAIARAAGMHVAIVAGDEDNIKITGPDDLARAANMMGRDMDIRLGNGYDVHRFGPGDHVWLCGVKVAHDRTLQGHSDADVGMHAITDAIYGALGLGDIGQHFPPSDPQWKGAESHIFLSHAIELARTQGFKVSNVDCTLICEFPKIGPHQSAMKDALAAIMGIAADRISVKATTSERLGFTGRGEGIASIATATLVSL